ncbi:MAG: hypothetical protein ABI954_06230 [Pyrinomonadaceae bacterium]
MPDTIQRKDQIFGDLTVVGDGIASGRYIFWTCSCSCGNIRVVEERRLVSGIVTMCAVCEEGAKMGKAASK